MIPKFKKYTRQIILPEIGESGQQKLFDSKVLVIGAGGLGCPALLYMTAAGIGTIGIVDYDKVEKNNLHRQVLFDESQAGMQKTDAAVEKLKKLNSDTSFEVYENMFNSRNGFEIVKDYDVVMDATDNFKSRYLINDVCIILSKPFVMGSINKFEGQIALLNYNNGPTYRCIYPEVPGSKSIANCEDSGVIGSLAGIVGTIMATEATKLITGSGKLLSGEILFINSLNMEFRKIKVQRNQVEAERAYMLKEKLSLT